VTWSGPSPVKQTLAEGGFEVRRQILGRKKGEADSKRKLRISLVLMHWFQISDKNEAKKQIISLMQVLAKM
jgi:hypothetical protein